MTDTKIDHAAEAMQHIEWAHEQQTEAGQIDETVQHNATLAVAEAVLALAEQQRIANLVAYVAASSSMVDGHKEWIETEMGLS